MYHFANACIPYETISLAFCVFSAKQDMNIFTKRYQPFLLDVRNCCLFFHKVINLFLLKETFRSQIHWLSCCKAIFCTVFFFSILPENIRKFLVFLRGCPTNTASVFHLETTWKRSFPHGIHMVCL